MLNDMFHDFGWQSFPAVHENSKKRVPEADHMSTATVYFLAPKRSSGARYQSVTTFCVMGVLIAPGSDWRYLPYISYTSSTARGGGGSFKNRKPIGEVGCCESGMAERSHWLTERWLELCLLEWLQWLQWSPHPQLLDVVWCNATVVVVVA